MTIAPKLRKFLDDSDADYDVIEHAPTKSAMQSAEAAHIPAERVAKAVLLETGEEFLLAVLPADHRIQISDLKDVFGQRPHLAPEKTLGKIFTDCASGAVPPLGSGYGIATLVDDSIDAQPDVYFEAGDHASLIHMSRREFSRLTAPAQHGSFSAHWSMME